MTIIYVTLALFVVSLRTSTETKKQEVAVFQLDHTFDIPKGCEFAKANKGELYRIQTLADWTVLKTATDTAKAYTVFSGLVANPVDCKNPAKGL